MDTLARRTIRRLIAVRDDRGMYDFMLGAEPFSPRHLPTGRVIVIGELLGWGPWTHAVAVIDGDEEPTRAQYFAEVR